MLLSILIPTRESAARLSGWCCCHTHSFDSQLRYHSHTNTTIRSGADPVDKPHDYYARDATGRTCEGWTVGRSSARWLSSPPSAARAVGPWRRRPKPHGKRNGPARTAGGGRRVGRPSGAPAVARRAVERQLESSTVALSEGEYERARAMLGDDYDERLDQYVDVAGRPARGGRRRDVPGRPGVPARPGDAGRALRAGERALRPSTGERQRDRRAAGGP